MKPKTILLVEDNPDDIELTKEALNYANILNEVVVATDGEEALEYLNRTASGPHPCEALPQVILLDLKLPKLDGFEVLRRIREDEKLKRIPVIILTSSRQQEDIARSYDLHANSYIRKPVDFDNFLEAIRQMGLYWLLLNEPPPLAAK